MVWLTLRQHRLAIGSVAALLLAIGAYVLLTGLPMHHAYEDGGVGPCLGSATTACRDAVHRFSETYAGAGKGVVGTLNLVPMLLGLFVGAPLLARELEQRTHRLVWTQGVSRRRWLAVKLVAMLLVTAAAAVAFTAMMTWWRWPLDQLQGRFEELAFNFEGPVVTAYALFAFALGIAAGVVLRSTVVAMGVTFAGWLALRLPVENLLRPYYLPPVTTTADPANRAILTGSRGSWALGSGFVDRAGHRLANADADALFRRAADAGIDPSDYLRDHGIRQFFEYQPADRWLAFQAIEAAIFVAAALLLLALALAWVRWRTA